MRQMEMVVTTNRFKANDNEHLRGDCVTSGAAGKTCSVDKLLMERNLTNGLYR